jgi:hypothetical protein
MMPPKGWYSSRALPCQGKVSDPLQDAQHHGLLDTLQTSVAMAPHGAGDKAAALFDRRRTDQKGLHLGQRKQLFVVHGDHHAPHHDRSQLPVQIQTPLDKANN